jgi:hypothetical protein
MAARAIAAVRLSVGALTAATRSIAREPLARVVVHSSGALLPATRAGWGGRRQGVAGTPRGNVAMAAARSLMANGDMTRCHVRSFSSDAEGPKDMGPDLGPAPPAAGFRGALPSIPRTRGYQGGSRLGVQGSNYSDTGFRNVGRDAYRQQRNPRFANNAGGFWDNGKFIKDPRKPDHFPRGLKVRLASHASSLSVQPPCYPSCLPLRPAHRYASLVRRSL